MYVLYCTLRTYVLTKHYACICSVTNNTLVHNIIMTNTERTTWYNYILSYMTTVIDCTFEFGDRMLPHIFKIRFRS